MRIKSYFAPSVQAAIALARKEFGDNITLVTSHVASLDNRHLGEYEVVFAIEEATPQQEAAETIPETPAPVFTQLFQEAVEAPSAIHQNVEEKLDNIHSSLVSLGVEAAVVRSFMTMLKAVLPTTPAAITLTPITTSAAPPPMPVITAPEPAPEPISAALEHKPAAPKPKITVIKPEPQPFKPEPPKPEPAPLPAPPPATANTRPFLSLFEAPRPEPRFSAAELAFMSSVSSNEEQKA
jgi:hypothetical protein